MNSNVHNSVYLAYCETAINEFIRANNLTDHFSFEDRSWAYLVRRTELVFSRPSTFEDELCFTVEVARIGGTRVTFDVAVSGTGESTPRTTATVTWVYVDTARGTAEPIPESTRSALGPFLTN